MVTVGHREPGKLRGAQRPAVYRRQPPGQRGVQPVLLRHLQLCPLLVQSPQCPQSILVQSGGGLAEHGKTPGQPLAADLGDGRLVHRHHHHVRLQGNAFFHRAAGGHAVVPLHLLCLFRGTAQHGAYFKAVRQSLRHPHIKQGPPAGPHDQQPEFSHGSVPPASASAAPAQRRQRPRARALFRPARPKDRRRPSVPAPARPPRPGR